MYPDYLTSNYGEETYYNHVEARDEHHALELVRDMAIRANSTNEEEIKENAKDFGCLLVLEGHHDPLIDVRDGA